MYTVILGLNDLPPFKLGSRMYFKDALDFAYYHREYFNCDTYIFHGRTLVASIRMN